MDRSAFGIIVLADLLSGTDDQLHSTQRSSIEGPLRALPLADPDGGPGLENRRFLSHNVGLYLQHEFQIRGRLEDGLLPN